MSHFETGVRAQMTGDLLMAQQEYVRALSENRDHAHSWFNLATVLASTDRIEVAIAVAERACQLDPHNFQTWNNLGYFLGAAGRFEACEQTTKRSLALQDHYAGWNSLGLCLYALGRWDEAVEAFDKAIALADDDTEAIDNRSNCFLARGEFKRGFLDNKVRWKYAAAHPFMHAATPEWTGENLTGKTIVVLHEQGFGDSFQFCRYVPYLKSKFGAARVAMSLRPQMISLMRLAGLADTVVGIHDAESTKPDLKVPMMTLPAYMDLTKHNIDGRPYLRAPMHARVLPHGKNVGLVWGGIPMYAADRWRSLHPQVLLPLVRAFPNVNFYSLQQDERRAELWQSGMNAFVIDLSEQLKDWSHTAAIIDELDLLISVDTAVAHLAGALGKPVATLHAAAACWRWMDHDTTTTPWYDSMRLYRQDQQGDWSVPIARLIADLPSLLNDG